MEEFAYHVFTSANSQPQYAEEQEALFHNQQYQNQQPRQQPSLEEVYVQSQQNKQRNHLGPSDQQPPPIPRVPEAPSINRSNQIPQQEPPPPRKFQQQMAEGRDRHDPTTTDSRPDYSFAPPEEAVERVAHSYDVYGQPIDSR